MTKPSIESVLPETGFLPDHRIQAALDAGYLVEAGTWEPGQLPHASYTIRLGHGVEVERAELAHLPTAVL